MSKVNLKCTVVYIKNSHLFAGRLYTGKIDDEGNYSIRAADEDGKKKTIHLSVGVSGEVYLAEGVEVIARFLQLKTKTILCKYASVRTKGNAFFKAGKRYMMEDGRSMGACAGLVFDEDGDSWNLYREDVGFSVADSYLFEAKYS